MNTPNSAPSEYDISLMLRELDAAQPFWNYVTSLVRLDRTLWTETLRQHAVMTVGAFLWRQSNTSNEGRRLTHDGDKSIPQRIEDGRFGCVYPDPPRPMDRLFDAIAKAAIWFDLPDLIAAAQFGEWLGEGYRVRRYDYRERSDDTSATSCDGIFDESQAATNVEKSYCEFAFVDVLIWRMEQEESYLSDGDGQSDYPPGDADELARSMAERRTKLLSALERH